MKKPEKNRLEWLVFAASACIVLAVVGYLIASALRGETTPPDIRITTAPAERTAGGHRVEVSVRNVGDQTAEEVRIEVSLLRGDELVESSELDLMFVPRLSQRRGWVTFRNDPAKYTLVTRAMSYEVP